MRKFKRIVGALTLLVVSGCGTDSSTVVAGQESGTTPLEILGDVPGFELEAIPGSVSPVLSSHVNANRIPVIGTGRPEANAPTVEYRFACAEQQIAQVFIYSPNEESFYKHWTDAPDVWTVGTAFELEESFAYGAPHRDADADLYSIEYAFLEEPWVNSGGAMGTEVDVPAVDGKTYVVVSSTDVIRYGDRPAPDSPQDAAFMDPYQGPIDCVTQAWNAALPYFG